MTSINTYVSDVSIQQLERNDWQSHMETFQLDYKGMKTPVQFCHQRIQKRDTKDIPTYASWLNEFLNLYERFVRPNSITIDVGAQNGDTSLAMALLCNAYDGGGGKVYAFEPGQCFSSEMNINLGLNPQFKVEGCPYALMPSNGVFQFLYSRGSDGVDYNGGVAQLNSWLGTYNIPRLVRGVEFRSFFKDKIDFKDISFVKTDTEGADFHILLSFKDVLKEVRPVIHAEWFPRTEGAIHELCTFLDYQIFNGFTFEHVKLGISPWAQDILLVPTERVKDYDLKME